MTFFDIKVAIFVKKIANYRKCTKPHMSTTYVNHLEFWKILDIRVHIPFTPYQPAPTRENQLRVWRERGEEGSEDATIHNA